MCEEVASKTKKKQFRGNAVIVHGFSGENMRAKRKDGGRPEKSIPKELQELVLPVLDYLTARLTQEGCTPRGGEYFANELRAGNWVAEPKDPELKASPSFKSAPITKAGRSN